MGNYAKKYKKIEQQLDKQGVAELERLLENHFRRCSCGCNFEGNDEDIYMCPIGLYEDGCREQDLVLMIRQGVDEDEE